MAATITPEQEIEQQHLETLSVKQLRMLVQYNQMTAAPQAKKRELIGQLLNSDQLPAYPASIPAPAGADQAPIDDEPETITEEELATAAADNGQLTAEARHADNPETPHDQLTLFPGGDKPTKSILRVGQLVTELPNVQFEDDDIVQVTFRARIEEIAFPKEKKGSTTVRRVRRHSAKIIADSVHIAAVPELGA